MQVSLDVPATTLVSAFEILIEFFRGILPLIDWITEPSFVNSALIQLLRSRLDAGDL